MQYILQEDEYKKLINRENFDKAFDQFLDDLMKIGKWSPIEYEAITIKRSDLKGIMDKLETAIKTK